MKTIVETAKFNIVHTKMTEEHAMKIFYHLIKHNYSIIELNRFHDDGWTIRAERTFTVYPESSRIKIDDLMQIFDKTLNTLIRHGKVNIEIDQALDAIDISIST